jgi:hypothetical protein
MTFRWCLWTRLKLALRKRPTPDSQLPYELDEFAELLSSRDPAVLKQLAAGLGRSLDVRPRKLRA